MKTRLILAFIVIGAILPLAGCRLVPAQAGFTEFYLVPAAEQPYPTTLRAGQEATVQVAIVSRERAATTYRLDVLADGRQNSAKSGIRLGPGEKWQQEVTFSCTQAGANREVSFLLYREGDSAPYRQLTLLLDITP